MVDPQATEVVATEALPEPMDTAAVTAAASAEQRRSSRDASSDSSPGSSSGGSSEDDSGSSSDESSSDDDLSDNETLADRHKSLKKAADRLSAKRRRSSSDSGSKSSSSGRRKRRNLFPVIRKSQRCGKCHTCLNPQLKKACLTVREQMMREATKGSRKATPSVPAASKPQPAAQPAPASSAAAASNADKYTDILVPFINSAGAVSDTAVVQPFIKALSNFGSSLSRMLPCTILGLSSTPVLSEFMAKGGVDVLSNWMLQAMEEDSDQATNFLIDCLTTLKKLPVTRAFVQSTRSAKVIGALRKHDNSDVRRLARDVVTMWMKVIPPSTGKASSKTPAAAAATAAAAEQRIVTDPVLGGAAALPATKRLKTTGQDHAAPVAAGANGVAARTGAGAAAAGGGSGSGIHVVSDNDLFKTAAGPAKPRPAGRLGLGMGLKQQKKTNLVQTLDPAEASRLLGGGAGKQPAAAASQDQQQQQQVRVDLQLVVSPDDAERPVQVTFKVVLPSLPTATPTAAAAAGKRPGGQQSTAGAATGAAGSRAPTTSSVSRLPGRRVFGAGLGARTGAAGADSHTTAATTTTSSISALLGGAWAHTGTGDDAAAGAAAGAAGSSGEPPAKKVKKARKRVVWKDEHELVAVRWFIKDDPPVQASKDAHLSDEQLRALAAVHRQHHNAFDQAARMEHAHERALIEQQHKEAEEAAAAMRAQIYAMQPSTEWETPPAIVLDADWQVKAGEDSTEAQRFSQSLQQLLERLSQQPPMQQEPLESHQLLQLPNALFNVPYHDRNVKILPLNTVVQAAPAPVEQQVQQQQQQQQQQPPPVQLTQPGVQQPQPQFPPGILLQPPQQQQQQQQVMLPGLQPQQMGGQLVLQPIPQPQQQQPPQQQQQLGGPPPPGTLPPPAGMFAAGPVSGSGPPSGGNNQSQLLQALQSLTQLQSQGGLLGMPGQPPQQQQLQQLQQQPPGLMPPGAAPTSAPQVIVSGGVQVMLPSGMVAVMQGQQGQQLQLPPGMVLAPMQQGQPQQVLHMQPPPQYEQQHMAPPPHLQHHQQHFEQQPPQIGRPGEYQQQQWGPPGGHESGGGYHRGGHEEWRRNKRECKFFTTTRGCQKGDACGFRHIMPGEVYDVRDERRGR